MSEWGGVLLTTARRVRKQTWLTALHVDVRAVPFTAAPPPEMIVEAQVGSACCQRACVCVLRRLTFRGPSPARVPRLEWGDPYVCYPQPRSHAATSVPGAVRLAYAS